MPALSVMIKPASGLCNLRCTYCFYHDVTEHREVANTGIMSLSTAYHLIEQVLSFANGESVAFAFQGGEPLLAGKDFFSEFVEYVHLKNEKNSTIYYSMQTNGLLLDEEWAVLLHENKFLVGLSLDGDESGNKFRLNAAGENSFLNIRKAADLLEAYRVEFNILTVVTGYTARNINRIYRYFRSQGFHYLQFIPCLRPFGDTSENELYMTDAEYEFFLVNLFNAYVKDYVRGNYISIRQFDNWVRLYLGQQTEQCGVEGHCNHQIVAEGDGSIYPCDFYCLDEWKLGNINQNSLVTMMESEKASAFIRESLYVPQKCNSCKVAFMCRAQGCKRNREDADHCKAYLGFFQKCLPLFTVFQNEK